MNINIFHRKGMVFEVFLSLQPTLFFIGIFGLELWIQKRPPIIKEAA
jgi:hypothetical protein